MKTQEIKELDTQNAFLHMCPTAALQNIEQVGLEPRIGKNAFFCESTPKVFFSTGSKGVLECWNAFVKSFVAVRLARKYSTERMVSKDEELMQQIVSGEFLTLDKEVNEDYYRDLYHAFKTSTYLVLNINPKGDDIFNPQDKDEAKLGAQYNRAGEKQPKIITKAIEALYSGWECGPEAMEPWNLHTKSNCGVPPERLSVLTKNGQPITAWEIVKASYATREKQNTKTDALDAFMAWALEKEKQEQTLTQKK